MIPNMYLAVKIHPAIIVTIVVLIVLIIALFLLYRFGTKMQKKSEQSQSDMKAASQTVSLLVIDKKRLKLKEAGLPSVVIEQTPKYLRGSKLPIAKVKIGPKVLNMICDEKIFDIIPLKKEVKAVISGIYIMEIKGARGGLEAKPAKVGFFQKMKNKVIKKK